MLSEGGKGKQDIKLYIHHDPNDLKNEYTGAGGKKAKMLLTVVIFGRYNYKRFLFAALNFSVGNKVEKM